MLKLLFNTIFTRDERRKHLLSKLGQLLGSIPDRTLRDMIYNNCFFAGGCVRDLFTGKKIKDYDVFFKSQLAFDAILPELKKAAINKNCKFTVLFESTHTYTIKVGTDIFQFCKSPYVGSPKDVISRFDYTNCMAYYDMLSNAIESDDRFKDAINKKELVYNKDAYNPTIALKRYNSFVDEGWEVCAGFDYHSLIRTSSRNSKNEGGNGNSIGG